MLDPKIPPFHFRRVVLCGYWEALLHPSTSRSWSTTAACFGCCWAYWHEFSVFVAHCPQSQCEWNTTEARLHNIPETKEQSAIEQCSKKRMKYCLWRESGRRKDSIQWGESDMTKMFLPVTEDRMWLQVWLDLEGHFAIVEGWEWWVMTSSHLWENVAIELASMAALWPRLIGVTDLSTAMLWAASSVVN